MPTSLTVPLAVVAVLLLMRKPIARIFALLFVRRAVRGALGDMGRAALARLEDVILAPEPDYSWKNDRIEEQYVHPLRDLGFTEAGAYSTGQVPGVHILMLVHVSDRIQANVYEHPQVGSWLELVSRYENKDVFSVTNLPPQGVNRPPWITTIQVEKSATAVAMVQRMLKDRKSGALRPTNPKDAKEEFEIGYAQFMAWKRQTGISPEEVARQIERRLETPAA